MGKGVRHNLPPRTLLNPIVSDCAGRTQAFLDITGFKNLARFIGSIRPDARKAVGLQLKPDR